MMLAEMKIKIRSLSAEMTMIRRTEERHKHAARRCRAWVAGKFTSHPNTEDAVDQAKGEVDRHMGTFWSLHRHRYELKVEMRATLLAYGFLRGKPYAQLERHSALDTWPEGARGHLFKRAERLAQKFGAAEFRQDRWVEWLRSAELYLKNAPGAFAEK